MGYRVNKRPLWNTPPHHYGLASHLRTARTTAFPDSPPLPPLLLIPQLLPGMIGLGTSLGSLLANSGILLLHGAAKMDTIHMGALPILNFLKQLLGGWINLAG